MRIRALLGIRRALEIQPEDSFVLHDLGTLQLLEGNVQASDRVELRKSAVVTGDISTQRISIEEGAYLKGKVDIHRTDTK